MDPAPAEAPLILPGFVDLHIHWPQSHVRGQFSGQLLPWLRESIWPAEAEFAAPALATRRAAEFLHATSRAGTCGGLAFGPPFASASAAFQALAWPGWLEGPALMERHAPAEMLQPVAETLAQLEQLPGWQQRRTAVSPRFAPNVAAEGLALSGQRAREAMLAVQSHLSENTDEIAWVAELFRDSLDYTDVYDRAGLLGPHVVMAHGIHLSDRELARLAATGTLIAHCPTSNEALGSGRMPLERLRGAGVPWVLATDIGAGPQLSQLDTMRAFLNIHKGLADATATEALCRASAVPGHWLGQFDPSLAGLGSLAVGAPAHLVALAPVPGDDAETVLRNVLQAAPANTETLPRAVWVWGQPAF
jgi:guanine deaminase